MFHKKVESGSTVVLLIIGLIIVVGALGGVQLYKAKQIADYKRLMLTDPPEQGDTIPPPPEGLEDAPTRQAPTNQINDYVGTWMGGIQQGLATMPFKFQFNADMTCTVWPADEPVVNTTYEIVEGGKFLVLFNNNNVDEAFQGSASQGETGKFLDFCYHTGISKDSTGRMRSKEQMCGTAKKR